MTAAIHLPMWLRIGDNPEQQVGHIDLDIGPGVDDQGRAALVLTRPPVHAVKRRLAVELRAMADHLEHEADAEARRDADTG